MFNKDDFCNINYIEFDDDFNIELNQKSKIIFGYTLYILNTIISRLNGLHEQIFYRLF